MEGMNIYIGSKLVTAKKLTWHEFIYQFLDSEIPENVEDLPGMAVCYPDGYVGWNTIEEFTKVARELSDDEKELLDEVELKVGDNYPETWGSFVQSKILMAKPASKMEYNNLTQGSRDPYLKGEDDDGYMVKYPNKHISWSPKEEFEKAYRKIV